MDHLNQDFREFIGLLEAEAVEYLIVGVNFVECYQNRMECQIQGLLLKFIGKDDLIRNKLASGRAKDRIDVDELERS